MVSKWEGGLHTPSVFWQGKLCALFAATPEQLGLVKRTESEQQEGEQLGIMGQEPALASASLEPAESERVVAVGHLMAQAWAVGVEPPDGPTWCGQQITNFTALLADWQGQGISCLQLQGLLHSEIERWTIAQQPDEKLGDEFARRRTVLAALVMLPPTLLSQVQVGPLSALLVEDLLGQSATSLTACWHLLNGDGLATVEYALPSYLPLLVALARQPSKYQQRAAYLAAQGSLLMSLVSYHRLRFRAELAYAKQAVELAKLSGNRDLHVYALVLLGGAFNLNEQRKAMLQAHQEAAHYLDEVAPPLRSYVLAELAYAYALNGQVQEALRCSGAARDLFPDQFGAVPHFIAADYGLYQLILFEGMTHLVLGERDAEHVEQHSQQAGAALAQFAQLSSTIIVPERSKIEIINYQAAAAVGVGSMEEFEYYLLAGVEGAKALGSEKRRQEAIATWKVARQKWPHEARVRELAEVFLL